MKNIIEFLTPVFTLIGVWIGHRLTIRRIHTQYLYEKKIQYITDFLCQAYNNLEYLALPGNKELVDKGLSSIKDFTILGNQASLFVSETLSFKINKFTSDYCSYLLNIKESSLNSTIYFKKYNNELNKLKKELVVNLKKS